MLSLLTLAAAFAIGAALTAAFIRATADRGFVALENHRSMHAGAVPTGGGWPLLAAAFATALILWPATGLHWLLAALALGLALLSWANDVSALPAAWRLAAHLTAAALLLAALPADALVFRGALPWSLDRAVAAVALAWFMNLYNFMDGIDSLAGIETISLAAGYAVVTYAAAGTPTPLHGLALALAGASAGFLVFNWPPARIFLGDVGSIPVGFLTGALMIDLAVRHSLLAAMILPAYFAIDATLTLARRTLRGDKPWEAHREHAYQRAARGFGAHRAVTLRVAACNIVLIAAAVLALSHRLAAVALAAAALAALFASLERAAGKATASAR